MEEQWEDLLSAIASYGADRQIITFSKEMVVLPKGQSRGDFQGAEVIGYFFHEWIHFLHNVSTIHGISAFASFIGLWNAFRFTTDEFGFGQGAFNNSSADLLRTRDCLTVLNTTRRPVDKLLRGKTQVKRYRVVACDVAVNAHGVPEHLDVTVDESNEEGETVSYRATFGATELVESVAELLEDRFVVYAFGQMRAPTPVFPYHSLTLLAKHLAPNLGEKEVLLCGLSSLQSTYPAHAIFKLLTACRDMAQSGQQVDVWLEKEAIRNLERNAPQIRASLDEIHGMFPVDVGVARAVKSTASYMRKNFEVRMVKPFFELDLIEEIRAAGPNGFQEVMTELMEKHGICSCQQQRDGLETAVGRDDLFNFKVAATDADLNDSRLSWLASYHHLLGHIKPDGDFQSTGTVERRCPFFTSCKETTRKDHPDDCDKRPWRAVITRPDDLCRYAVGVKALCASSDMR